MKNLVAALVLLGASFAASAGCVGSGSFKTCSDDSGNNYTVQQYGNSTHVQGNNAETGNSWSQESYKTGNTTQTYGTAANGNSWNSTTIHSQGMTQQYGTDSDGNSFSKTCTQAGCF